MKGGDMTGNPNELLDDLTTQEADDPDVTVSEETVRPTRARRRRDAHRRVYLRFRKNGMNYVHEVSADALTFPTCEPAALTDCDMRFADYPEPEPVDLETGYRDDLKAAEICGLWCDEVRRAFHTQARASAQPWPNHVTIGVKLRREIARLLIRACGRRMLGVSDIASTLNTTVTAVDEERRRVLEYNRVTGRRQGRAYVFEAVSERQLPREIGARHGTSEQAVRECLKNFQKKYERRQRNGAGEPCVDTHINGEDDDADDGMCELDE